MAQVDTLLDGSDSTSDKLLRAALHLFARQGLDVPLRDINELAGQRNASALHYHFGGRTELVQAIIDRYRLSDEEHAAIEAELRAGPHEVREVVEGLVDRSCAVARHARRARLHPRRVPVRDPPAAAPAPARGHRAPVAGVGARPGRPHPRGAPRPARAPRARARRSRRSTSCSCRWPSAPASSTTKPAAASSPKTSGRPTSSTWPPGC